MYGNVFSTSTSSFEVLFTVYHRVDGDSYCSGTMAEVKLTKKASEIFVRKEPKLLKMNHQCRNHILHSSLVGHNFISSCNSDLRSFSVKACRYQIFAVTQFFLAVVFCIHHFTIISVTIQYNLNFYLVSLPRLKPRILFLR